MEPMSAIRERIAAKRHELNGLQRRIEVLQAELRTWEEALALITGNPLERQIGAVTAQPSAAHSRPGGPRKRRLTDHWRRLLGAMATDSTQRQWSLDDMEALADLLSIPMQRNTLRSQMSIYADRYYVRRVKDGVYEVTESGAREAGVSLGPAHAAPSGAEGIPPGGDELPHDVDPPHDVETPDKASQRPSGDLSERSRNADESKAADTSLGSAA